MINVTREAKKFLKPAKKLLKCSSKSKRLLYITLETTAKDFLSEKPDATLEEIHTVWGDPKEFVQNFMGYIDPKEIQAYNRRSKWILALTIIGIALLLMAFLYVYMYYGSHVTIIINKGTRY